MSKETKLPKSSLERTVLFEGGVMRTVDNSVFVVFDPPLPDALYRRVIDELRGQGSVVEPDVDGQSMQVQAGEATAICPKYTLAADNARWLEALKQMLERLLGS